MIDRCARTIDYLRISVTDRCNLRCVYCMPEDGVQWIPHNAVLSYEEILRLCRVFAGLGLSKIKLTGGEPLVRLGIDALIADIKAIPGISCVTLTTNGVLLADQLSGLVSAGLDGVNISLDTLDREQFRAITRRDELDRVLAGLNAALDCPGLNVKINCLPMGSNDNQLVPMVALAKDRPLSVRFIEVMPIGLGKDLEYRSEAEVRAILEAHYGPMTPFHGKLGNGPCHYFSLPGFVGKVGFISALSHQFCSECNRVRLTSEGFLKTCLQYELGVDLKALMDEGRDDEFLAQAVQQAIYNKPLQHHFADTSGQQSLEHHGMSQIGG